MVLKSKENQVWCGTLRKIITYKPLARAETCASSFIFNVLYHT